MPNILNWDDLDKLLCIFAKILSERFAAIGSLPSHFYEQGIDDLPVSIQESRNIVLPIAKHYIKSAAFHANGASIETYCEKNAAASDSQLYEELTVFLFSCSGKPYVITKDQSGCSGLEVFREEILYWNEGCIKWIPISEALDPVVDEFCFDRMIESYLSFDFKKRDLEVSL